MEAQLHLIPSEAVRPDPKGDWRLDDRTRVLGRRGIEEARAALRSALRQRHAGPDDQRAGRHASAA